MGRRVKHFLIIIPAVAVVLFSLLLTTCSNKFDIFEAIKTEMKIANDLFLEVESVSPANNAQEVSQTKRIEITFDRMINENTINTSAIQFNPPLSNWEHEYIAATDTLYIYPDPFLSELTQYTVTVTSSLKGTDGSDLQEYFTWAFETKESPRGDFFIEGLADADNDNGILDQYTNSTNATVKLYLLDCNTKSNWVGYGTSEGSLTWYLKGPNATDEIDSVPMDNSDNGVKTFFVGFSEDGIDLPAADELKVKTIILDTQVPSVLINNKTIKADTLLPTRVYSTVSDQWSGIANLDWSAPGGSGITFLDSSVEDPYINAVPSDVDDVYTLTLTATDGAGNVKVATRDITIDNIVPPPPDVTGEKDKITGSFISFDGYPTWVITSNDATESAEGFLFRFSTIGDWDKTASTKITPKSALSYGPHTIYVIQFDDVGNTSDDPDTSGSGVSFTMYVSPTDIYPYWGQLNVSTPVTFDWPDYKGGYYYDLYVGYAGEKPKLYPDLQDSIYKDLSLPSGRDYEWFYVVKDKGKRELATFPGGRDAYFFTTAP